MQGPLGRGVVDPDDSVNLIGPSPHAPSLDTHAARVSQQRRCESEKRPQIPQLPLGPEKASLSSDLTRSCDDQVPDYPRLSVSATTLSKM